MNKIVINCAVFCFDNGRLKVLLSKREMQAIYKWGVLARPLKKNQNADEAALGLLNEFGMKKHLFLRQLRVITDSSCKSADPVITIVYYALVTMEDYKRINLGTTDWYQKWWNVKDIPDLQFNHNKILDFSLYQLSNSICESPVGFDLLPKEFTLSELVNLYHEIVDKEIEESSFCKKMLQKRVILPLDDEQENMSCASRKLYKFNVKVYEKLIRKKLAFLNID